MSHPKTNSTKAIFSIWMFLAIAVVLAALTVSAADRGSKSDAPEGSAEAGEAPEIVLYQTSWCGYCRKAGKLLKDLDAEYVVKDIEKNQAAAREYREKGRGYRGIPLIAYDDQVLKGYDERGIRAMVKDQKKRSSSASD